MCAPGTHEAVHARLSRRGFFAVGAAATAAATIAVRPAKAQGGGRLIDLTHTAAPGFPGYSPDWGIVIEKVASFAESGFNMNRWTVVEHFATHLDAPIHFSADGLTADQIPVEQLMCPLAKFDIAARAADDPEISVTPDDIAAWEGRNGPVPAGACAAMHSGWEARLADGTYRNAGEDGVMRFPGFHPEAAAMLMERGAVGMAVDTLSLDVGSSSTFDTHYRWLPSGRWGLENVASLGALPEAGATIIVGAPKVAGATGGMSRVFALV